MMNICGKFHRNPSNKYKDTSSRKIDVNGQRADGWTAGRTTGPCTASWQNNELKGLMYVVEGCEINVHKNCVERVRDACGSSPAVGGTPGKKQEKQRQPSVFGKMMRKGSNASASKQHMYYIAV